MRNAVFSSSLALVACSSTKGAEKGAAAVIAAGQAAGQPPSVTIIPG